MFSALSSMYRVDEGVSRKRRMSSSKKRGSGLRSPTSAETSSPSNHSRNGNNVLASFQLSEPQLVAA